jgi:hypothetical protein
MLGPAMHLGIANSGSLQKDRAMPVFHSNSRTGDVMLADIEGEELPDLAAARTVALSSAREVLAEAVKFGYTPPDVIQVTDSEGNEVAIVSLLDVLQTKER